MIDNFIISDKGFHFTLESVATMRQFEEYLKKDHREAVIYWTLNHDRDEGLIIVFGGDKNLRTDAILDEIDGFTFYWYAPEPALEVLRDQCIDVGWGRDPRLIPLRSED